MAFDLVFENRFGFEVDASYDDVFTVLSDIPLVSSLHPNLDRIVDLGNGHFRWEMKKLGTDQIKLQLLYTCLYQSDRNTGTISWAPAPGEGNVQVTGRFQLQQQPQCTRVETHITSILSVPLPGLMKKLVQQFASREDKKVTRQYVDNLIQHFGRYHRTDSADLCQPNTTMF